MKPDISALLDDELDQGEASRAIDALRRDEELRETWHVYHLIGDALRQAPVGYPGISAKVMARLTDEPVLFAPSAQPKRAPLRFALPLAAAITGVAAVGWVTLSLNTQPPLELAARPGPAHDPVAQVAVRLPSGALKEYIVAHQAHSPSGRIQGGAPYVRSVSEIRQGGKP